MSQLTILDGGMSRELVRLGAELRQPEWSALALMHSPDLVRQAHLEFLEAGADVVTTNSYALVPFHIGEGCFNTEGRNLLKLSGQLARQAVDAYPARKAMVAGSLPPIFGSYEPQLFDKDRVDGYLTVFVQELKPFIDIWLGETLSLVAEGEAVVRATSDTGKATWISFTLRDDGQADIDIPRLRSGETVEEAARWAASRGIDCLLFNCSRPEVMEAAVRTATSILGQASSGTRVGVYANAFEGSTDDDAANETLTEIRDDLNGEQYGKFACRWVESGATVIGGCCGIGSGHIHQLRAALVSNDA